MNRRTFLQSAAAVFFGTGSQVVAPGTDELAVSVWFSEAASRYDGLADRVAGYLDVALRDAGYTPEIAVVAAPVSLPAESGTHLLATTWPRRVVQGRAGLGGLTPVDGVNLLVTDGDPRRPPSGYGYPGIAATTGARYLARMAPPAATRPVVPYSLPAVTTQLLLHEVGHALGLDHEHGRVSHVGDGVAITSPMLSAYAWRDPDRYLSSERSVGATGAAGSCVDDRLPGRPRRWQLQLRFDECETPHMRTPS